MREAIERILSRIDEEIEITRQEMNALEVDGDVADDEAWFTADGWNSALSFVRHLIKMELGML